MPKANATPATEAAPDTAAAGPEDALFNGGEYEDTNEPRTLEEIPIGELLVVRNPRKTIDPEGLKRLAGSLMRRRQLIPGLGWRRDECTVELYDGQRRKLAAELSHDLAGCAGYESLQPVGQLRVLLFDREPTDEQIRRAQAHANAHEALTIPDLQAQFAELWADYDHLPEPTRMRHVCEDLDLEPLEGHNLRRQLTLPEQIRTRVSRNARDGELSIRLANHLASMHTVAPALTEAVADRVVTTELLNDAVSDLGSFVHRTVIEDDGLYAVRLREGTSLMVAHREIARAREHLRPQDRDVLTSTLRCSAEELDKKLEQLERDATTRGAMITIDPLVRDRAVNGRFAYVHARGADLDDAVWIVDPAFMLSLADEAVQATAEEPAQQEPSYFQAARDEEAAKARDAVSGQSEADSMRQHKAYERNLALGQALAASMIDLKPAQLEAVRALVCHLLAERFRELIAYGAGWTDPDRQQPVGDTRRFEPRQADAIVEAELERALNDRDPLRGIAQLVSRLAAGFVLDPLGVSLTKTLGRRRMEGPLRDALPGGDHPGRRALWELVRPALSPALVELHKDSFLSETPASTADLDARRATSDLAGLDLGDDAIAA